MKNITRKAVFFWAISALVLLTMKAPVYAGAGVEATPTPVTTKGSATTYGGQAPCIPVYGGGVECPKPGQVMVEKRVRNPATGFFVNNLGPNDPKYMPQTIVTFQVTVRNPGENTIDRVTVTDTLPAYFDFMNGPGTYDGNTNKLTWDVYNISPGDTQSFTVQGRVSHAAKLPEQNIICPTDETPQPINIVDAAASNGQTDHAESRYCIAREFAIPTGETPKAGPENWLLSLSSILGSLGVGLKLRKKS